MRKIVFTKIREENTMKAIYISDELHRRAKQWAAQAGLSLKEVIEGWAAEGLRRIPAETPGSLREIALTYSAAAPIETALPAPPARPATPEALPVDLVHRGVLVSGEQLQDQLRAEYLAVREMLGITTAPLTVPPDLDAIRESFRQQRLLHPNAPTVTEFVAQMREEE
jgi:hypothetical protein